MHLNSSLEIFRNDVYLLKTKSNAIKSEKEIHRTDAILKVENEALYLENIELNTMLKVLKYLIINLKDITNFERNKNNLFRYNLFLFVFILNIYILLKYNFLLENNSQKVPKI